MKVQNIKSGEYFLSTAKGIVARKTDTLAIYLNSPKIVRAKAGTREFYDNAGCWGDTEVELIDFNQAVIALIQECIELNEPQPTDSNERVDPKTLPNGQYFVTDQENIGRIYNQELGRFVYLTPFTYQQISGSVWECTEHLDPVYPLSMNSAILFLTTKLIK